MGMGSGEQGTGNLQNWEFLKVGIFKVGNLKKRESFNWESLKAGIFKMANLKNAESLQAGIFCKRFHNRG